MNRNDLRAFEAIERKVAAIRVAFQAVAEFDGVKDALKIVDQLDDIVARILADVEMELYEARQVEARTKGEES